MLILSIPQTNIQVYSPTEVITNKSVKMFQPAQREFHLVNQYIFIRYITLQ